MKILCFTDNHFCERSSIINKFGTNYSIRLENQIQSLNWVEQLATDNNYDMIICCGDFFDKAHLTDQELTALQEIKWNKNIPHYFLVGNHESEESDLQFSSTKALAAENRYIIDTPKILNIDNLELAFLPYVGESCKQPLTDYFGTYNKDRILFSHNDILGLQMGLVESKTGFSIDELEANCTFCINGHLHNGQPVSNRILNLGNLTGKDFGEDGFKYTHKVLVIDTDTFKLDFIENPYAFNFYKLDISSKADLNILTTVKPNAVISVKCVDTVVEEARQLIEKIPNIIESRITLIKTFSDDPSSVSIEALMVDQCVKFAECCREKLENTPILEAELAEILK